MMKRSTLTIVSWNLENLARRLPEVPSLLDALGTPDVLCLQEARIRPQDEDLVAAMRAAAPGYVCHASLARDPKNVTFRGGRAYGVVTYVRESLGKVHEEIPDWDREGRIVITAIERAHVAVLNVYAVNGTDKPYFDHERGAIHGDRHAFKRRFQAQVFARAAALRDAGLDVIIAADWNVSRTREDVTPRLRTEEPHALARAELNELLVAHEMVDVWRARHPAAREYSWVNPRARRLDGARVDYIVVSEPFLPRVTEAAILTERRGSDHAPLTLTFLPRAS